VIDSGIDLDHPAFGPDVDGNGISDRIIYNYDFHKSGDSDASDGNGHGTHVSGIIGSSNSAYPGIAPGVNIIALKVFPDEGGWASNNDIKEALDWVTQHIDDYNILSVNLSLGGGQFDTEDITYGSYSRQFKSLADNGVIAVAASGNGYGGKQKEGVSYPSSDLYALSIGAVFPESSS